MADIAPLPTTPAADLPVPWRTVLAAGARWGMTALASWLVSRGVTTPDATGALIDVGAGLLLGLASLIWSLVQKWLAHKTLGVALTLPAGATVADLHH